MRAGIRKSHDYSAWQKASGRNPGYLPRTQAASTIGLKKLVPLR